MLVFTTEGVIKLVNSQAESLFGYRREELLRKYVDDLLPASALASLLAGLRSEAAAAGCTTPAQQVIVQRADGTRVASEVSLTPIQSTEGARLLASIVDIGER